jgi:hypothetical protein
VSGIVKNWGAWGSMAPPTTVDIMVVLLGSAPFAVHGHTAKISRDRRNNKK